MKACHWSDFLGQAFPHHRHGGCGRGGPDMAREEVFEGGFGVRRPLRFLAHRLDLDERQVAALARILDELKTERAQAAGDRRVQSAERLRAAVVKALQEIHAALNPEQRTRFAYLIRTGALVM